MKHTISAILCSCIIASCSSWTDYEALSYAPESPQSQNPDAYSEKMAAVKEYKQSEHNVTMAVMKGTASVPSFRWQHPMDMPDSVDYICIKEFMGLHQSIVDEIAAVREIKGTKTLAFVDYAAIKEEWVILEDKRAEEGGSPYTAAEKEDYFKTSVQSMLAEADRFGFDGVVVSVNDMEYASDDTFMDAVAQWKTANPEALVFIRGYARYVSDVEFASSCRYYIVVAGETASSGQLILQTTRNIGSGLPTDRVLIEASVPSEEEPEQIGITLQDAAQWVLDQKENRNFTPQGIVLGNAHDDYWCENMIFGNLRSAIGIMNTVVED